MADEETDNLEEKVAELEDELDGLRVQEQDQQTGETEESDAEQHSPGAPGPRSRGRGAMMGGGSGGHPFAQMMQGSQEAEGDNRELVREVRQLRDEVRDVNRKLEKIADHLANDTS